MKQCMYKITESGEHSIKFEEKSVKYSARLVESDEDFKAAEADGFVTSLKTALVIGEAKVASPKPKKKSKKKLETKD